MGRLGPRAVPPPRSRQGVLKTKVYKNRVSKKEKKKLPGCLILCQKLDKILAAWRASSRLYYTLVDTTDSY